VAGAQGDEADGAKGGSIDASRCVK
jgi:hypothetical protein